MKEYDFVIIGLTGGIASGKSTASEYLKELGAIIIDGDKISREVIEYPEVISELINIFGNDIVGKDRKVDRKKLGFIVFNDKEALEKLNYIMHKRIGNSIKLSLKHYQDIGFNGIVVFDMPLLIESKMYEEFEFDEIWLVSINEETQIQRLMSRNGFNSGEAMARVKSQMLLEEKKLFADIILDNSGNVDYLKEQVKKHYDIIKKN